MPLRPPRIVRRLLALLTWDRRDREMEQEMAFHIESIKDDLIRSGMSEAEAERSARRRFGSMLQLKEEGHDVRSARLVEDLTRDARHMARGLRKSPVFTMTRRADPRPWHRRQHRDLLRRRSTLAATAPVSTGRTARHGVRNVCVRHQHRAGQ